MVITKLARNRRRVTRTFLHPASQDLLPFFIMNKEDAAVYWRVMVSSLQDTQSLTSALGAREVGVGV